MVFLFDRTSINNFSNYISHKLPVTIVKELADEKNDVFQSYLHSNKDSKLFNKTEYLQNELKFLIEAKKEKYYSHISKKLMNPLTSTKTYWSISNLFLDDKKIPCMSPLLRQNRYNTKYKWKADLFNNLFANHCSTINNSGVLPLVLFRIIENVIFSINFCWDDISKIIQKLNPNKAEGHDMINIHVIKICGSLSTNQFN